MLARRTLQSDALTTVRDSPLGAATRLFLALPLVKETPTMNKMTLRTAILQFAFSGMLAPHSSSYGGYEPPRPAQSEPPKKK